MEAVRRGARLAPGARAAAVARHASARRMVAAAVFGALSSGFGEPFPVDVARSPQSLLVDSTDGRLFFLNQ